MKFSLEMNTLNSLVSHWNFSVYRLHNRASNTKKKKEPFNKLELEIHFKYLII